VTASAPERARRRWLEMTGKGIAADIATVLADIHARDAMDAARAAAPLRPADDAVLLDTTDKDPDAAFAEALRIVRARLAQ
jgi:cytidylate kinase